MTGPQLSLSGSENTQKTPTCGQEHLGGLNGPLQERSFDNAMVDFILAFKVSAVTASLLWMHTAPGVQRRKEKLKMEVRRINEEMDRKMEKMDILEITDWFENQNERNINEPLLEPLSATVRRCHFFCLP